MWWGCVAYLKGTLEHVDEEFIGNDIKLLLILALNVRLSNCCTSKKGGGGVKTVKASLKVLLGPLKLAWSTNVHHLNHCNVCQDL